MKREWVWVWTTLALSLIFYAWIFGRFIPLEGNKLGHDYALHFPNLLAGHFWVLQNGFFSVPWFTPAQCGGLPFYADLNVGYYALPQFLTLWVSPLAAIKITFYVFAGLGFLGTYAFLRKTMQLSLCAALVGAMLYFWNGFYVYRMLIGHLVDHGFMLLPWILYFLNRKQSSKGRMWQRFGWALFPGILWAYIFHSGGTAHILFPGAFAVIFIGLFLHLLGRLGNAYVVQFIFSGLWAIALCVGKLNAALAFLSHFPRDFYDLMGIDNLFDLLRMTFQGVFFSASSRVLEESLANNAFTLDLHELEYGLSPLPLILFALYGVFGKKESLGDNLRKPILWILLLLAVLPLILNFHSAFVHEGLKSLWFLSSQVNLMRWFSLYTLILIPLTAYMVDQVPWIEGRSLLVVGVCVAFLVVFNAHRDKTYYEEATGSAFYAPQKIEEAYEKSKGQGIVPIEAIAAFMDTNKKPVLTLDRNDILTKGYSQLACYQPLFGYRQEQFPGQSLQPGPIYFIKDSFLNFKNPACYLFPQENGCVPGDHFPVDQLPSLELLAQYKPFDFQVSARQRVANVVNGFALALALFVLLAFLRKKLERIAGRNPEGSEHGHV